MAVRVYRDQALGVSLVSLGLFLLLSTILLGLTFFAFSPLFASSASFYVRIYLWLLLAMYWIDSSMRASIDLDPLSRNSLHWNKLRYLLWALNFAGIGVFAGFLILTGDYRFFDNPSPGLASTIIAELSLMPFFVTSISGTMALPIGAFRSRDRNFKRQLQWFALALFFFVGLDYIASLVANNSPAQGTIYSASFLLMGYCLYRSAHALVPLSRIPR
jgi:hypothetical protein